MSVHVSKRLISAEEYHKMGEAGILQEKGIELINGEILKMSPIGSNHLSCVNLLTEILFEKLNKREVIISVQNPIRLDEYSEPEPEISLLKRTEDHYSSRLPNADDTLLVIEIAESSLEYDRTIKLPLYAENAVPEFWLINLKQKQVEAYWEPSSGAYRFRELLRAGDILKARHLQLEISVEEIFG